MKFQSKREAAYAWVQEFNAIPIGIVVKLINEVTEVTPPSKNDPVEIFVGKYRGHFGEVIRKDEENDGFYIVDVEGYDEPVSLYEGCFDVEREDVLPMWGTMWSFKNPIDQHWLADEDNLQAMADCGFRIYEQEDYGYIFGIDAAGYDFYESHWIPLYDARGLHWHEDEVE